MKTIISVPSNVTEFNVTNVTSNSVSISWTTPTCPNGKVISYETGIYDLSDKQLYSSSTVNLFSTIGNLTAGMHFPQICNYFMPSIGTVIHSKVINIELVNFFHLKNDSVKLTKNLVCISFRIFMILYSVTAFIVLGEK